MTKLHRVFTTLAFASATLAVLVTLGAGRTALALNDDYTLGDFENMQYVGTNPSGGTVGIDEYNGTVPAGQINNGPTPEEVTGSSGATSNPPNVDYPPPGFNAPVNFPAIPGPNATANNGNWNVTHNTGFGDWGFNGAAIFSNSTTVGVTHGSTAIVMNPNLFTGTPVNGNYSQHLALKVQNIGLPVDNNTTNLPDDTTASQNALNAFVSHKYLAIDVTYKASDWTHGTFSNTGAAGTPNAPGAVSINAYINSGFGSQTTALGDHVGFQNLGTYVQNPANPGTGIQPGRPADVDSRQALLGTVKNDPVNGIIGSNGTYDPANATGTYTTTLYYNYANWQAGSATNGGGGPSLGTFDLRSFVQQDMTAGNITARAGWLEFVFATSYDNGYTGGKFYFDNMRFTNFTLALGDFNNDGHINAADIAAAESALTNTAGYEANPIGLSGETLSAQDMLTVGDVNGDGVFNGADIQALLLDIKAGKGSVSTVPEPASLVLLGLALPALGFMARRKRRSPAA